MTDKKPTSISDKQKAVRMKNMEKARNIRMANLQRKKTDTKKQEEYDLSSNDESESSDEDFIISKKKQALKKKDKPLKEVPKQPDDHLKTELNDLRNIVTELAMMQRKHGKKLKASKTSTPGIVVVSPNQPANRDSSIGRDTAMDTLRRALNM
jgi:hypothetical protein